MKLLTPVLLDEYKRKQKFTLNKYLNKLEKFKKSRHSFELFTGESSVYSSQIEGSTVTETDYIRYKEFGTGKGTDRINEVFDLENAYLFAKKHPLSKSNLFKAHKIATATILKNNPADRGKLRKKNVRVGSLHHTAYFCPAPEAVKTEFEILMEEVEFISRIKKNKMTTDEAFYYASLLHLVYVKIHPFIDGNGRTARLLEKWFLAQHFGVKAWFIRSEKFYKIRQQQYYRNLSLLGRTYNDLDYKNALPFLLMLPWALKLGVEEKF